MKKLLAFILCLCVVFTGLTVASADGMDTDIDVGDLFLQTKTYSVPDMAGKYKAQGRTTIINNILMTDYSASGIEFYANCAGDVSVTFNASSLISGNEGGCYFTVIVDGVQKARDFCHITATGETTVKLAENLLYGKHTFEIYRQTEIERAVVGIKSVTLSGEMLEAPYNSDLFIEFVGDSITTAYGNLTKTGSGVTYSYPKYQDATQGYAYLTAKALDADWSLVAQQGRGAKYGYTTESLLDIYPKLRYNKDKNTNYDFARQPDYVVIALGTNDISTYSSRFGKTLADVKQGFKEMLSLVRTKNPNAKIIWAYNMMTNAANDIITSVISEAGGEEKGYYSVQLTQDKAGGNNHPYYTAHATMAKELTAFINKINAPEGGNGGDVNGDGTVDLNDVVALAQIVAGWQDVEHVESALDTDASGGVDLNDVVVLAQHVAGWDVEVSGGIKLDYSSGSSGVVNKISAIYTDASGFTMPYNLYIPKDYNRNKEYPVLLFYHGADGKGTDNQKPANKLEPFYKNDAKTMGQAIVLIPQCPQHEDEQWGSYSGWWRYNADGKGTINVAMNMLRDVVFNEYRCDIDRLYVMGVSMGGEATWKTLEHYSEKVAAAVPMCGSRIGTSAFEDATKFADTPIWIYHGTVDKTIPFSDSETRYKNLLAAGAQNTIFTVLEGWDHNVQDYACKDNEMFKWLFAQKR